MTEKEKQIWCAGVLEGEGCFRVKTPRYVGYRPVILVNVGSTDKDVIERIVAAFPGSGKIAKRNMGGGRKPMFVVEWYGKNAETLMKAIKPYMGVRRKAKIDECLATKNLSHTPRKQSRPRRSNGTFAKNGGRKPRQLLVSA